MKGKGLLIALSIIAALLGLYLVFKNKINALLTKSGVIKSEVPASFVNESGGSFSSGLGVSSLGDNSQDETPGYFEPVKGSGSNTGGSTPNNGSLPQINFDVRQWNKNLVLKKGSKGNEVAVLQWNMNKYVPFKSFTTPLVTDGNFGAKTEAALQALTTLKAITLTQAAVLMQKFS